jgi:AcrR family transcriptional regulator
VPRPQRSEFFLLSFFPSPYGLGWAILTKLGCRDLLNQLLPTWPVSPARGDSECAKYKKLLRLTGFRQFYEHVHFALDKAPLIGYILNMFSTTKSLSKSQETRYQILQTALGLFRQRGLDDTTMRDIAAAAKLSLGAAYYYFPSKEAIIQAYYDEVQAEHYSQVSAALAQGGQSLLERLRVAFHAKLDILQNDRKLLSALFRFAGQPEHPLSPLGAGTRQNRQQSMATFSLAIVEERLADDLRAILPTALWTLHTGILLYYIYDDSPEQKRTRNLVDGTLALLVRFLTLVKLPFLKPVRGGVLSLLRDAGLLEPASPAPLSHEEVKP